MRIERPLHAFLPCRALAEQGFLVVAPQFPISSTAGPTDVAWEDARDQIRDATYVLTQVLRQ